MQFPVWAEALEPPLLAALVEVQDRTFAASARQISLVGPGGQVTDLGSRVTITGAAGKQSLFATS